MLDLSGVKPLNRAVAVENRDPVSTASNESNLTVVSDQVSLSDQNDLRVQVDRLKMMAIEKLKRAYLEKIELSEKLERVDQCIVENEQLVSSLEGNVKGPEPAQFAQPDLRSLVSQAVPLVNDFRQNYPEAETAFAHWDGRLGGLLTKLFDHPSKSKPVGSEV